MSQKNRERIGLLEVMVPELFEKPGTVLYIGAYGKRFSGSMPLMQAEHEVTVLEVWRPFIEQLMQSRFSSRYKYLIEGDVREIDTIELPHQTYDYSLWFHGPEHVGCHELVPTIKKLKAVTDKLLVLSCPWGYAPHGIAFDNPHTRHRCYLYPEYFQRMGFRVACIGPKDKLGSHLLAWTWLRRD